MYGYAIWFAAFICQALAVPAARGASSPSVTIASGVLIGTPTSVASATATVNKFLGVPFAQSPPERFSPPVSPAPWTEPIEAVAFKDACIQQFNYPPAVQKLTESLFNNPGGPPPVESEDCLYLNVFVPSCTPPAGGFPVMFWIYGGDLQFGTASIPTYDGSSIAANQEVIVVTINYRTNVFGFSNSPQIPVGQQNSGFLDQRFALTWVQENIGDFGGNPCKVTIFGQSAGGYSVKQLIAAPPQPLTFRAAILESEAASFTGTGLSNWESLVKLANCTSASSQIDCVRALPATTVQNLIEVNELSFAPAYDNVTCVEDVRTAFAASTQAKVPTMIGTNANEGTPFIYEEGIFPNATSPTAEEYLNTTFPGLTSLQTAILDAYPSSITSNTFLFLSQFLTDFGFLCPAVELAGLLSAAGPPVWRYYFNASFPNTQLLPDLGVYHASEIPEVFGTYPPEGATQQEIELSKYMQGAWADFAKDPCVGPGWPALNTAVDGGNGTQLADLGGNGIFGEQTIPLADVELVCFAYAPVLSFVPI